MAECIYVAMIIWFVCSACIGYKVEVTLVDDGIEEKLEYEIVNEDLSPFETAAYNTASEDLSTGNTFETTSDKEMAKNEKPLKEETEGVNKRSTRERNHDAQTQMYSGVKVTGILGNTRKKRSMNPNNVCMKTKDNIESISKAVTVEVGESVHMPCHDCREDMSDRFESAEWIKMYPFPNAQGLYHIMEVIPDMHDEEKRNRISITLDHTLVIKRAKPSDAASYFCKSGDKKEFLNKRLPWKELQEWIAEKAHIRFYFHVDVLDLNHAPARDVSEYSSAKPSEPESILEMNVLVMTRWHSWSECSVCGDDGMRKRIGICVVKKLDYHYRVPQPYLNNILDFAEDGLPCQSEFLREYADKKWLSRPNEVQFQECAVVCQTKNSRRKRREITKTDLLSGKKDDKKKTMEQAVSVGGYVILVCPGSAITKQVIWVNGTEYVSLMTIQKKTHKRISFDIMGNLHISSAILLDSGVYTCWIKKKLQRKFVIKVTPDITADVLKYGMYLGFSFVADFVVFLVIVVIKFLHRKVQIRKKKKKTNVEAPKIKKKR